MADSMSVMWMPVIAATNASSDYVLRPIA
jgi:hypothetical protein